jgi:hypothetical protein
MSRDLLEKRKKEVLDIHTVYSVRYRSKFLEGAISYSLKPALGKIGVYCSRHLEETYVKKESIDSYKQTTLKDYK